MFPKFFFLVFLAVIAVALSWKASVYRHHLHFVPEGMGVWWVRYVAEESWGFGPGGNETGIIVYYMPSKTREAIEQQGVSWLTALPRNSWQGFYSDWKSTPVPVSDFWANPENCPPNNTDRYLSTYQNGCPSISGYMGMYGYNIPFDSNVERLVNQAAFSEGSFYAYGRIGMLIAIPAENRIVYVYNG